MGRLLEIAKAAWSEPTVPSTGKGTENPELLGVNPSVPVETSSVSVYLGLSERGEIPVHRNTANPHTGIVCPTRRCPACNSWLFWVSVHGVVRCSTCHPPARLALVDCWYELERSGEVREIPAGTAPGQCPPLPAGVRLIRYAPKTPPVGISSVSVVGDVAKFIDFHLAELDARLYHPVQIRAGGSVSEILGKLAAVGLELEIVSPSRTGA